ncbi:MAG: hypothetical protein ABIQ31_15685 [Ferruginibacter sp.]
MKINKRKALSFTARLVTGLIILFNGNLSYGQVNGCRDSLANNFNPNATVNDGSCTYNPTTYSPPVKVDRISDSLIESSGLQMAGNFLWSFNDGGGAAAIYRIDTITNTPLQKVNLAGAVNVDWEDIAFDGTNFYIGDFGNNANGARTDLKIYKFPFSAIPDYATDPVASIPAAQIEVIHFSYSDQPQPPVPASSNNTKFDCEAMIVDNGKVHLFTKNWIDLTTTHYEIGGVIAGTYTATPLETLATNYLVTAADKVPGQKLVVLMGYKNTGTASHFMHLLTDYAGENYFSGNKRPIDLPDVLSMGQAEGICFRTSTYGYISNEKFVRYIGTTPFITVYQKLHSFDISRFIPGLALAYYFIGDGNWNEPANWSNNVVPPPVTKTGSEIIIDPQPFGKCVLNIPYTVSTGSKLIVKPAKVFVIQGNLTIQ